MRLTTKGRYAVTAMLDLAIQRNSASVTLRTIAENQKISLSYLEQLFAKLRKHGLVKGVRGPGGGYRLSRSADEISIADIIIAVDEPLQFTDCDGKADCKDGEECLSHRLWERLTDQLEAFLSEIYLGALMRESKLPLEQHASTANKRQEVRAPAH